MEIQHSDYVQLEGNYYNKYGSGNPIVKRIMKGFWQSLDRMLIESKIGLMGGQCLEAGCGEGHVVNHLNQILNSSDHAVHITAFDISKRLIEINSLIYPYIRFFNHDIYDPLPNEYIPVAGIYDLVICCEVLEHMKKPDKAIQNLMKYGSKFIFSVPHEPIWRIMNMMRGKYMKDFGNTPGHIQHFSIGDFRKLLDKQGLRIISIEKPLPWIMVYCEKGGQ